MSLPFVPPASGPVEVSGCPALSGLTPGAIYIVSGLTQGLFGGFTAVTVALDATTLSQSISVFPAGAPGDSYPAEIDWADCQLTHVRDSVGNDVSGKGNIELFPWFNVNVTSNTVDTFSSIGFTNFPGVAGTFNDNHLLETVLVINSGAGDTIACNDNFLKNANVQLLSPGTSKAWTYNNNTVLDSVHYMQSGNALNINNNFVANNGSLDIECANAVDISLLTMVSGGQLNMTSSGTTGTLRVNSVLINNSSLNFSGSIRSTLPFLDSSLSDESIVTFDGLWDSGLTHNFRYLNLRSASFLHASNVDDNTTLTQSEILGASTIAIVGSTNSQAIVVEGQGVLSLSSVNLVNGRLQAANSAPVSNLTDATKSGYVNALP